MCTGKWKASSPAYGAGLFRRRLFLRPRTAREARVPGWRPAIRMGRHAGAGVAKYRGAAAGTSADALCAKLGAGARQAPRGARRARIAADYEAKIAQWNKEVRPPFDAAMKAYNTAKWAGGDAGPKPEAVWPEPANPDPDGGAQSRLPPLARRVSFLTR